MGGLGEVNELVRLFTVKLMPLVESPVAVIADRCKVTSGVLAAVAVPPEEIIT